MFEKNEILFEISNLKLFCNIKIITIISNQKYLNLLKQLTSIDPDKVLIAREII